MTKRKNRNIKSIKKEVKAQLSTLGETKHIVFGTGGVGIPAQNLNTSMVSCYENAQGLDTDDRVGDKTQPTSVKIKFTAYRGNTDSTLRLIAVRFKISTAILLTDSILYNSDVGTTNYINAPFKIDKADRQRFEVLHDSCYVLDDGKQNHICKEINIKVNSKPVLYEGPALADKRVNDIFFVWISDSALASAPSVFYTAIARYKDI